MCAMCTQDLRIAQTDRPKMISHRSRLINVALALWLELWFGFRTNGYGTLGQNDFGKPVTDPCCENVRVHYKQRTVYEILNLHHDDLRRGINCFQRVCPSEFPAFYRVMYVGGLPGTSVSFAVCSDGDKVNIDEQEEPNARGRHIKKRSTKKRKFEFKDIRFSVDTSHTQQNSSQTSAAHQTFVFSDKTQTSLLLKLLEKDKENRTHWSTHQLDTARNMNIFRKKREADTSRTLFEIPEPRPSVVYTLTGVCFCLRVVSHQQLEKGEENQQPVETGGNYNFIATNTNTPVTRSQRASSSMEFYEKVNKNSLITNSYTKGSGLNDETRRTLKHTSKEEIPKATSIYINGRGSGCWGRKNCTIPEWVKKRRRRSLFMDYFFKSIMEAHGKIQAESTIPSDSKILTSSTTDTINQREPTVSTRNIPIVHGSRKTRDPQNEEIRARRSATLHHDETTTKDKGMLEDNNYRDEKNDDDESDNEEIKDRFVVFASFSHDVHFIGSISMTVSIASSCKSNVPLKPESTNVINQTSSTTVMPPSPSFGDRTTVRTTARVTPSMTTTGATVNMTSKNTTTTSEETSTTQITPPPKEDTRNTNLVEEVKENDGDAEESESRFDILLVWQVSAGAAFAILLLLIIVLFGLVCRNKKRKRKDKYASFSPESTLSRSPQSLPTNVSLDSEQGPNVSNRQHSNIDATAAPDSITMPRTIQAISRNEHIIESVNVGTVYPMHIRLRSLSSAAEAARVRGQEALRVLNNDQRKGEDIQNSNRPLVPLKTIGLNKDVDVNSHDVIDKGYIRAASNAIRDDLISKNDISRPHKNAFNPTIVVPEGSNVREFDLGQFAIYRNDIMLKLRRCGLRTGKHRQKLGTGNRDYDNEENDGTESIYSCYAGGETDI